MVMNKLLLLALLIPGVVLAADTGSPDSSFYKALAQGGLAEVDLGQLASDKAANPSVKHFGEMMVKDHSDANHQLESLAASKSLSLPDGPDVAAHAKKLELQALSGNSFDKSYVANQVEAHQKTLALLHKEIDSGQDADAKAFARKVLPTVQSHLTALQKIATTLGVTAHASGHRSATPTLMHGRALALQQAL
jgi:putative membrane protein